MVMLMVRVSAPSNCSGFSVAKSRVFWQRAFQFGEGLSESSYFGTSTPARRADAPLAKSAAIVI